MGVASCAHGGYYSHDDFAQLQLARFYSAGQEEFCIMAQGSSICRDLSQVSGYGFLKTKSRVRIRAWGHGMPDHLSLG